MKRRYAYALPIVVLVAAIAAVAWIERPSNRELNVSGDRTSALLTLYHQAQPVPSLTFQDATGQTLTLDDFRGRVLLVNIWATWCPPCRKEMPSLDRLQARLGGPGFQVVAISQDRAGLGVVEEFYNAVGIAHLTRYIDGDAASLDTLKVVGLPTSMLVDRQGRALGYALGARRWASDAIIEQIEQVADLD